MSKKRPSENQPEELIPEDASQAESGEQLEESAAYEQIPELDEVEGLRQQLEEALVEASRNLDGWQRSKAEFINYRNRIEREQARMNEDSAARVIKRFLPVVDDLHRALQDRPQGNAGAQWAEGIELIYRKLLNILENEGVTQMEALGQFFDPNLHEAISQVESPDHESGQIIEIIQQGYMIGERVLRAALVRVAS